jgi:putative DNA primase/helicase
VNGGWAARAKNKSPTPDELAEWFKAGRFGIGVIVPPGACCVDIDAPGRAHQGVDSARQRAALEPVLHALAALPCDPTPTGGRHYWTRIPDGWTPTRKRLDGAGIEVKVVATFVRVYDPNALPAVGDLPAMPTELTALFGDGASGRGAAAPVRGVIREGARNETLTSLAGTMRRRGMTPDAMAAALLMENRRRCRPPLPEAEVRSIARSVGRYEPMARKAAQAAAFADFHFTDAGNAEAFAFLFGDRVRFVHGLGIWRVWDGRRWRDDDAREVDRLALRTARARLRAAADIEDATRRKAAATWALASESAHRLRAMVESAACLQALSTRPHDYDRNPDVLNVENGLLDLRSATLRPHDPAEMCAKLAPVTFDSAATCPRWEQFLAEVFDGDGDLERFAQIAAGYTLTGRMTADALILMLGSGRNGKGVFLATLRRLLGDYARVADFATFSYEREKRAGVRDDLAAFPGARLVTAAESSVGLRLSEGLLKQLTGRDPITARHLYAREFTFNSSAKIWLATNHRPRVRDASPAFWARIRVLSFPVSFAGREDRLLEDRLADELPGILNWALAGALQFYKQDMALDPTEPVRRATDDWRQAEDTVGGFIADCCEVGAGFEDTTLRLYEGYRDWCARAGERERDILNRSYFGRELAARGFAPVRVGAKQVRGWRGLALR